MARRPRSARTANYNLRIVEHIDGVWTVQVEYVGPYGGGPPAYLYFDERPDLRGWGDFDVEDLLVQSGFNRYCVKRNGRRRRRA